MLTDSARFYYRMHSSSRAGSPTRTGSVSPSGRSTSPGGNSPLFLRRNLTLPPGSQGHLPGANLSTSLSPNSRFLQQHLPPTFPLPSSAHPSPETADTGEQITLPAPSFHAAQVILTPTTQEWQELKEIGRLEGDHVPESDSDSGSPSPKSPNSGKKPSLEDEVDYFSHKNTPDKSTPEGPLTPGRPVFQPVITAPSPMPPPEKEDASAELPSLVLQDMDGNSVDPDAPISTTSSLGFNSFGRRDSLRVNKKAGPKTPKAKTKRELEREKLFKMVDQEIAENPESPEKDSHTSWNVRGVGSGSGLDSRSSRQDSPGSDGSLEPEKKLEEPSKPGSPPGPTPSMSERSPPQSKPERSPSHSPEAARTITSSITSPSISSSVPARPSPLQTTSFGVSTPGSDGSGGSDVVDLASQVGTPAEGHTSPAPETETERYEAIRHYARQLSTRKSIGFGPSRPGSRAQSRRGSYEDGAVSPPRSPRRRDTLRVSLVAGRVVKPAEFPAITPLTPSNPAGIVSPKASLLNNFSPFRRASPVGSRPPLATVQSGSFTGSFSGTGSYASSIAAPSECPTPSNEQAAGGVGGRGIDDYVILKEAGKGAYGLVMRAKVKGAKGEPVGVSGAMGSWTGRRTNKQEEVIIKYIIKSRILADCWKKHKALGPIPVESE